MAKSKGVTVILPDDLKEKAEEKAREDNRTLSNYIMLLVKNACA